jgi:hypothetical protein
MAPNHRMKPTSLAVLVMIAVIAFYGKSSSSVVKRSKVLVNETLNNIFKKMHIILKLLSCTSLNRICQRVLK